MSDKRDTSGTSTSSFGSGRRQNHDASKSYSRFAAPTITDEDGIVVAPDLDDLCILGDSRSMTARSVDVSVTKTRAKLAL